LWSTITLFGDAVIWVIISLVVLAMYLYLRYETRYAKSPNVKTLKKLLIVALVSLLIGFVLVTSVKELTHVPRPCIPCDPRVDLLPSDTCNRYCPYDHSFPSGHAAIAFIAATAFVLVINKKEVIPIYILAILVAVSRIALGVHYWGDVIAGASLGTGITILVWRTFKTKLKM